MGFRMTMLWAIDVATLAWSLHKANLAVAFPALVGIGLYFWLLLFLFFVLHFYIGFCNSLRL